MFCRFAMYIATSACCNSACAESACGMVRQADARTGLVPSPPPVGAAFECPAELVTEARRISGVEPGDDGELVAAESGDGLLIGASEPARRPRRPGARPRRRGRTRRSPL